MYKFKSLTTRSLRHHYLVILTLCLLSIPLMMQAQFTEIPTGLPGVVESSVAWGDYDNDGDLDILLTGFSYYSGYGFSRIYRNDGNGVFTDIVAGLTGNVNGDADWGDYDNDGDLDILLTGLNSRLYRNDGNNIFTYIAAGLPAVESSTSSWGDYDNDGDLDILLTGYSYNYGDYISRIYRNEGNGVFTDVVAGLPGNYNGNAAWGDYDNDGDLDILLTGYSNIYGDNISRIYRNDGNNTFTDVAAGLPGVSLNSIAWGDYDNDGDLDILLAGYSFSVNYGDHISRIYRNDGSNTFTDIAAGLPGVFNAAAAWGDYDNDGDLDILLTGYSYDYGDISRVYRNDGNNTFNDIVAGLPAFEYGTSAWGDYDNDGDLDILMTGDSNDSKLYSNISAPTNSAPASPTNLRAWVNGSYVRFEWDAAIDAETPAMGLNYVLRIGTTPGGSQITAPMASSAGYRLIPDAGSINSCNWKIKASVIPASNSYWSVQAIDGAYSGSAFAPEATIQTLKVIAPNGGEIWQVNTTKTVYWSAVTAISTVNIYLSVNNGTSWIWLNASPIAAALGRFSFTVPVIQSTNCLVKVVNAANSSVYDISDNRYIIRSAATARVTLTAPAYPKLQIGKSYNILWTASGVTNVKLEYSTDAYQDWTTIIAATSAGAGSYAWTVPDTPAEICYLRVSDAANPLVYDWNDNPFKFCSLALTNFNAQDVYQTGSTHTITWSSAQVASVRLDYSPDNGANWAEIIAETPATSRAYSWTVAAPPSNHYLVRISDVAESTVNDISENEFSVAALALTYPSSAGIMLRAGSPHNITWDQQSLPGTVKLELTTDSGVSYTTIATGVNAAAGSYAWTVSTAPDFSISICHVRISSELNSVVTDSSDESFTILPQIIVIAPNGNEHLTLWNIYNILWTATTDVSAVTIDYSIDSGANWLPIQTSAYPAWLGSYEWIVPFSISDNCLIRVQSFALSDICDVSDAEFAITPQVYPPSVDFAANVTAGGVPLTVQFTDQSLAGSGDIASWFWDFGDGNTSIEQNPQHVYTNVGVYSVTLTVINVYDSTSVLVKPNYINVMLAYPIITLLTGNIISLGMVNPNLPEYRQTVWLKNSGTTQLTITAVSFYQSDSQFAVEGLGLPLQIAAGDSAGFTVCFSPTSSALVYDSLYIHNDSLNQPYMAIQLIGLGEYAPPKPPTGVSLLMDGNNAMLSWDAVTQTIFDTPIMPDFYLVFFNGSGAIDGNYYYLARSSSLSYLHDGVGLHSAHMFYRVRAYKYFGSNRNELRQPNLTQDMTEAEVLKILNR